MLFFSKKIKFNNLTTSLHLPVNHGSIHGKINTERIAFRCIKLHHKIMWIQEKKIASDRGAVA